MISNIVTIRNAESKDIDTLYKIGIVEESFAVSSKSRFYPKNYLEKWIENPNNDVLLVAETQNEIIGFLFCRVNRNAWAILENIVVSPSMRRQGIGTALLTECLKRLDIMGINYIGGILREDNSNIEFFINNGFSLGHRFIWIERHIKR